MPNAKVKVPGGYLDMLAFNSVPIINGLGTGIHWQTLNIDRKLGVEPSVAKCWLPMKDAIDRIPGLVGENGLNKQILHGNATQLVGSDNNATDVVMLNGRVTDIDSSLVDDTILVDISDIRWDLAGIPLVGSYWLDPIGSIQSYIFREGLPPFMNRDGHPNCFKSGGGSNAIYVFCPPNYNLNDGDIVGQKANAAEYWTPISAFRYFYQVFKIWTGGTAAFPWIPTVPSDLIWNSNYATCIENSNKIKKLKPSNYDGVNIAATLEDVANQAGPFSISIIPNGMSQELKIVRTRFSNQAPINLNRAIVGKAQDVFMNELQVTGGNIRENSQNTYTKFVATGQRVCLERRLAQTTDDDQNPSEKPPWPGNKPNGATDIWIKPAWTEARQKECEAYILSLARKACTTIDDCPE